MSRPGTENTFVMQQQAMFEAKSSLHLLWTTLTVSVMLLTALVLGAFALAGRIWPESFAWLDTGLLLLMQGASLFLIALALLLRRFRLSCQQRVADCRDRQLQAMLSMFRVVKHELNNDMQVVVGNAELASMMLDPDTKACRPVENIHKAASLAIDRIQQLTVFSASGHTELASVDLNALLRETVARLTNEMPALVMFRMELDKLPGRIMADRSLLSLSLSYLIRLAGKSLFSGGEILVRTTNVEGVVGNGDITVTSEILIVRGLLGAGSEKGVTPRDADRRARFASVLTQAQDTTTALVERSGATVLNGSNSVNNESLIKMGFNAALIGMGKNEVVLEDNASF